MSAPLTDAEIAAIRARCDAATPGPWIADRSETTTSEAYDNVRVDGPWFQIADVWAHDEREPNGAFIAHAREDVPRLLAALAAAEANLAALKRDIVQTAKFIDERGTYGGASTAMAVLLIRAEGGKRDGE